MKKQPTKLKSGLLFVINEPNSMKEDKHSANGVLLTDLVYRKPTGKKITITSIINPYWSKLCHQEK